MHRLENIGEELTPEQDELLDNLILAGALNEHKGFLYSTEDFKDWLQDWKTNYPEAIS
jgi:hypothetical protein